MSSVSLALALCVSGLAACTTSTAAHVVTSTIVSTITSAPSAGPTLPVTSGPTISASANQCPLLTQQNAADKTRMRLDRITVQSSGGKVVGCRLFALEDPTAQCDESCLDGEHLPPGNQPAVTIESVEYASPFVARNVFIQIAKAGTAIQKDLIAPGNIGLCFQTDFWSAGDGKDWACSFSRGTTVVVIRTVVTDPALNVVHLAQAVAPKI